MLRRPSAKQLAKAHERFKSALTEYVISKGARPSKFYAYELDTPAGILRISIYDTWIATRFDDVAAGKLFTEAHHIPSNPYSGKWNFHFSNDPASLEPNAVITHFGHYLDKLLNWQPTT